jgi:hypothetical protein
MSPAPIPAANGEHSPRPLPESADAYTTLLESTKAIPWKIDWASMRCACIANA